VAALEEWAEGSDKFHRKETRGGLAVAPSEGLQNRRTYSLPIEIWRVESKRCKKWRHEKERVTG